MSNGRIQRRERLPLLHGGVSYFNLAQPRSFAFFLAITRPLSGVSSPLVEKTTIEQVVTNIASHARCSSVINTGARAHVVSLYRYIIYVTYIYTFVWKESTLVHLKRKTRCSANARKCGKVPRVLKGAYARARTNRYVCISVFLYTEVFSN